MRDLAAPRQADEAGGRQDRELVVLGVNSTYHESAACLVRGGEVLAVAEEERFNRKKHAKPADVGNADEVPAQAIESCLARAGVAAADIDHVAFSFDPGLRAAPIDEPVVPGSWGHPDGERRFLDSVRRAPEAVGRVLGRDVEGAWVWVAHELAHAASAYLASPFTDAAVLSIDGIGEASTALLAHGRGEGIDSLATVSYPNSLGFVWEKFSKFTGLDDYSAPKLMALAAFASPERYRAQLRKLVTPTASGFEIDLDRLRFRVEDYEPLEDLFGPRRRRGEPFDFRYAEVCAALQEVTEEILFGLAEHLHDATGSANLCVAGGVALNCVAMGRLLNEGPFDGVFVQPLAHDAGTALGAALLVSHTRGRVASRFVMTDPYLGPSYTDEQVQEALAGLPVSVRKVDAVEAEAARLVADGLVIGWFQGAAEVGPRALGNRSIVADPRRAESKELINLKIKHREYFRPFAPSVLEEHAGEWVAFARDSVSLRFMSFALSLRDDKRALVPAVAHVDGTCRPQLVSRAINPRFHGLIEAFRELTGVPLVLNTSFNTFDEPIVQSPQDALRTFHRTGMDALVLGDYVVEADHVRREGGRRATAGTVTGG